MFSISTIAQILVIVFAVLLSFMIGFLARLATTNKLKKRMLHLENEMLANHAEILKLENTLTELNNASSNINEKGVPVVTLKQADHNQQKRAQ
jgi:hypothetical protein